MPDSGKIIIGLIQDDNEHNLSVTQHFRNLSEFKVLFLLRSIEELDALSKYEHRTPHIVFMDIRLPGSSGFEAITQVLHLYPATKIVILTDHIESHLILNSFSSGAVGYISRKMPVSELEATVHDVLRFGSKISPDVAMKIVEYNRDRYSSVLSALSKREQEIVLAIQDGRSYKELASMLFLSVYTINHHLKNIYKN